MPPKAAAEKKPAASKAPAAKAPAEKKEAGKKTAASGDKKKRTKTRKETYSSYIYKGTCLILSRASLSNFGMHALASRCFASSKQSTNNMQF
jgi:histone H2B